MQNNDKQYIRGNAKEPRGQCIYCKKLFFKNNPWQVIYFCSKNCRNIYKQKKDI